VVALASPWARSSSLPTTRAGWDRLVAQVRGLAELAEELAGVQRRLAEVEAEVARLEAENRELRERLEGRG
jgi:regulator of replication initiation timing